MVPGRNLQS